MTRPLSSHLTPGHAQQLAVSEVAFGNVQPPTPPPTRPLEKPCRASRSLGSQELWFTELAGNKKSSRADKHRKKRLGHVVVPCIKKCSIDASSGATMALSREEGFLFGLFRTFTTSTKPYGA
uniref:Uncharacterized protein n=1 Tax=Arundo donax TaxID=35708 RepID=A0A0A9EJM0_ARUDO